MKLSISSASRSDLREISEYIAADNPKRAISFIDELVAKFYVITERPRSFPGRYDLDANCRTARHGDYYIFFQINGDAIEILRVMHGARNIDQILEEK